MTVALHHQISGDGPPIVILHGLFGASSNWRSVGRSLAASFRVIVVDQRNHGQSPHTPTMRYEEMASDVVNLLDTLDVDQAAIIGHSMGGKTAMKLALSHPSRVERLCVVDIAPMPSRSDHGPTLAAMRALNIGALANRAQADAALSTQISEPGMRAFVLQNLVSTADGYAWRINLDAIEASIPELLNFTPKPTANNVQRKYLNPTLFIRGEQSDYLTQAHLPSIQALFPSASLATVRNAGHWVHAEQPKAFLDVLRPFLGAAKA